MSSAAIALRALVTEDAEQRKIVIANIIKFMASGDEAMKRSAAAALGAIAEFDPEERHNVVNALYALASDPIDPNVQPSAVAALGAIASVSSEQHEDVVRTLGMLGITSPRDLSLSPLGALGMFPTVPARQREAIVTGIVPDATRHGDPDVQPSAIGALGVVAQFNLVSANSSSASWSSWLRIQVAIRVLRDPLSRRWFPWGRSTRMKWRIFLGGLGEMERRLPRDCVQWDGLSTARRRWRTTARS